MKEDNTSQINHISENVTNDNVVIDNTTTNTNQTPKNKKRSREGKTNYQGPSKKRREGESDAHRGPNPNRVNTYPKRKIAVLFGYNGANYHGLQRNPDVRTVEIELEKAMTAAGVISPENAGSFMKVTWTSCARTDKGVSASGNVVSLKALMVPDMVDAINKHTPDDLKVFECNSAQKSFSAKNKCTSRLYHYIVPTYAFAPSKKSEDDKPFVFDEGVRQKIIECLSMYMGTNRYHNFTSSKGPNRYNNPRSQRVIFSLGCSQPYTVDGEEFVEISIQGQSFVFYQIRKMVGMVISIVRDGQSSNVINACFQAVQKILPVAPALGLYLRKTFFEVYNSKCVPIHKALTWEDTEDALQKFTREQILPYITSRSKEVMDGWLEEQDKYPLSYEYLMCTTQQEVNEKFPEGQPRFVEHVSEEENVDGDK